MSSMGAAPPTRQPWRGTAAPCHGRLGAWDIHPLALGRQSAGGGLAPIWGREPPTTGAPLSPLRRTGGQDVTGWPANPKLVRHLKSTLIQMCVHVDEAVMGLSVHTDEDGAGDNPLLPVYSSVRSPWKNKKPLTA